MIQKVANSGALSYFCHNLVQYTCLLRTINVCRLNTSRKILSLVITNQQRYDGSRSEEVLERVAAWNKAENGKAHNEGQHVVQCAQMMPQVETTVFLSDRGPVPSGIS